MFYKVEFSAESIADGVEILDALLEKKLVTGGQLIETPSRFLWKGEVIDQRYVTVTSFTVDRHRDAISHTVEEVSKEEVPMVCFLSFEANPLLEEWISTTVGS